MTALYESEAEIIIGDVATSVYVRFDVFRKSGGFKSWSGTLDFENFNLAFRALDAGEALLRMPDGKEGRVLVVGPISPGSGEGAPFTGTGPAPI